MKGAATITRLRRDKSGKEVGRFQVPEGGSVQQVDDEGRPVKPEEVPPERRKPTKKEVESMLFAWKVCKHVWSNAIILAKGEQVVGIGAGRMSRQAGRSKCPSTGPVLPTVALRCPTARCSSCRKP